MKLCFLIPASPTDGFLGQIAMFRRSLDALGRVYRDASVVAVFGDAEIDTIPDRWRPSLDRVLVHHVSPEDFKALGYHAQVSARWSLAPDDCDLVLFADADVLVVRPIDELLARLEREPAVAGVIAHYPIPTPPGEDPEQHWQDLFRRFLDRPVPLEYQHTLARSDGPDASPRAPFYVNFGFVCVPREWVQQLGTLYRELVPRLQQLLYKPYFAGQVALTLAVSALELPHIGLDMRYNFPNDPIAEERYPVALADLRVIHYLRTQRFDRPQIFSSEQAFQRFLGLGLAGSERLLQKHVGAIGQGLLPSAPD
jgi:hypothetical protein